MANKTIYPMGHGMFVKRKPVSTLGQLVFPLSKTGPFALKDALINGISIRQLGVVSTFTDSSITFTGSIDTGTEHTGGIPLDFSNGDAPLFLKSNGNDMHKTIYQDGGTPDVGVSFIYGEDDQSLVPTWPDGFDWTLYRWTVDYKFVLQTTDKVTALLYFAPEEFTATSQQKKIFTLVNGEKNTGFISVLVCLKGKTSYTQKLPNKTGLVRDYAISGNTLTFTSNLTAGDKVFVSYSDADTLVKAKASMGQGDYLDCSPLATDGTTEKAWQICKLRDVSVPIDQTMANGKVIDGSTITSGDATLNLQIYDGSVGDITSGISIRGPGIAKTKIHHFETLEDFNEYWQARLVTNIEQSVSIGTSGWNYPEISNIQFEFMSYPLSMGSGMTVKRCKFLSFGENFGAMDNRYTFKTLPAVPPDPNLLDVSESGIRVVAGKQCLLVFEECEFEDCRWMEIQGSGSGLRVKNCYFHDSPNRVEGARMISFNAAPWWMVWGLEEDDLMTKYCAFNDVDDCKPDENGWGGFICDRNINLLVGITIGNAQWTDKELAKQCNVRNSTFVDFCGFCCVETGFCAFSTSDGHRADGNTFIRCDLPIIVDGYSTKPSNCHINNNVFIDHDQAPMSPWFWGGKSPAIFLAGAARADISNNDYTLSGILPHARTMENAIVLTGCEYCMISELDTAFPELRPIANWVVDIQGHQNFLNRGQEGPKTENPNGITATVLERLYELQTESARKGGRGFKI